MRNENWIILRAYQSNCFSKRVFERQLLLKALSPGAAQGSTYGNTSGGSIGKEKQERSKMATPGFAGKILRINLTTKQERKK
jgi:hypothetical protein